MATIHGLGSGSNRLCAKDPSENGSGPKGRCQEEEKDEGIVKMNKSKARTNRQLGPPARGGSLEKAHQRVVWSLIFIVFGVHLVKAEEQENREHKMIAREVHQDLQVDTPWMRKGMMFWEICCLKLKRKKIARERTQKTVQENSLGRDPNILERNSQGKDPRTFEENSQGYP